MSVSETAFFWTLSTIPQVLVAGVAFTGVIVVWRLQAIREEAREARRDLIGSGVYSFEDTLVQMLEREKLLPRGWFRESAGQHFPESFTDVELLRLAERALQVLDDERPDLRPERHFLERFRDNCIRLSNAHAFSKKLLTGVREAGVASLITAGSCLVYLPVADELSSVDRVGVTALVIVGTGVSAWLATRCVGLAIGGGWGGTLFSE